MQEYSRVNSNNSFILLKSELSNFNKYKLNISLINSFFFKDLSSQRLFKLLLTDEQNTATTVINTFKNMFMIKKSSISKLSEKTLLLILNEVIYKMVSCDLKETGL